MGKAMQFMNTLKIGLAAAGVSAMLAGTAYADAGFRKWISDFYSVAAKNGISRNTYNSVFEGVRQIDPLVLERANYQPEFTSKVWDYLDARVTKFTIAEGQRLRRKYKRWFDVIEKRFGVDRDILLAIWSIETIYGDYLTRPNSTHHIGQALATLAYKDRRRSKYARTQLVSALKIVQNGDISAKGLRGSWAGAMGHTQFIPTSYQAWAVDIDGDGRRDVWNSPPDALASAANLLRKNGWVNGQTWGYEVVVPKGFNTKLAGRDGYKIRDFEKMGVKRANGRPFRNRGSKAVLKFPGGTNGPAFLMMRNFYVLKRYNNADKYALAVGHLADRIAGYGPIIQQWPRGYVPLNDDERFEAQKHLKRLGFYDGEIDGNIGSGSRAAIREFQERAGMKADGNPSRKLLKRLRKS
ncbi:lytic murein transglycosylase [Salaquimonas pukyongi]|uniref:lytic murein transglycosylase n=1 Tax=Salaquimonas pukyongi TaxID=2712698 RepID=UPI00096BB95E|nr:lytic murein transglycosylase [Salaquimonas pukyongi]